MRTIEMDKRLGPLFKTLHKYKVMSDGKAISDSTFSLDPADLLDAYNALQPKTEANIHAFFKAHFSIQSHHSEFKSNPCLSLVEHIEQLWDHLARRPQVLDAYSTLIPLPYDYTVPGGRFNEVYYWDSFFTMLGLAESGRWDMIQSMIDNFKFLIDTYGFIPNGNRSYFLSRSQPPFYVLMLELLYDKKGIAAITPYIDSLEKEHAFWVGTPENYSDRRLDLGSEVLLNRYYDDVVAPRAEMFQDDIELLENQAHDGAGLLLNIKAACESGWDFSSRWCRDKMDLSTLSTIDIAPVDLNCLLFYMESKLASWYEEMGDSDKAPWYRLLAVKRKKSILSHMWHGDLGYFCDYRVSTNQVSDVVSAAGIFPLSFNLADEMQAEKCVKVLREKLLSDGGVLTTDITSGQQWDAPNGWAPLQWMTVMGLTNYGYHELSKEIMNRWVNLVDTVYKQTGKIMEKYNVVETHLESGGGEYPVQDGFGWTNGVTLKMINLLKTQSQL